MSADATTAEAFGARALGVLSEALELDEAYLLAVDPDSLLFTRLLAYRGGQFARFVYWLREVYLIGERDVWDGAFPQLLGRYGGFIAAHERTERWIGKVPRPPDPDAFRRQWRRVGSPPGGGLRFGLAHRGQWIGAIQAGRWAPGPGFRARDVALLQEAGPILARGLHARLRPTAAAGAPATGPGHLVLDQDRVLMFGDELGLRWIERLPGDGVTRHGMDMPVAVQCLVNQLAASPEMRRQRSRLVDAFGVGILVEATAGEARAGHSNWFHVTIHASPLQGALGTADLTPRQRAVAEAVAQGRADREIAASLAISATTVREHVAALHAAFGSSTRSTLVAILNGNDAFPRWSSSMDRR